MDQRNIGVRTEGSARAVTWTRARRLMAIAGAAVLAALPVAVASAADGDGVSVDATGVTLVQSAPAVDYAVRGFGSVKLSPGPITNRGSTWT